MKKWIWEEIYNKKQPRHRHKSRQHNHVRLLKETKLIIDAQSKKNSIQKIW